MPKVWVLQHIEVETLGTISDALDNEGVNYECVRPFNGEKVPENMDNADGLIIMGGPMGVYEQDLYPYLSDEMHLIEQALKDHKPVLGTCLGSQLLAAVLGAPVIKGVKKEIGWHEIRLTQDAETDFLWSGIEQHFTGYHWHGDIFELPLGAASLASSEITQHQAFRYNDNAYGFLFHMEVTGQMIEQMVAAFQAELIDAGVDGAEIIEHMNEHLPNLYSIGQTVYRRWAGLVGSGE